MSITFMAGDVPRLKDDGDRDLVNSRVGGNRRVLVCDVNSLTRMDNALGKMGDRLKGSNRAGHAMLNLPCRCTLASHSIRRTYLHDPPNRIAYELVE